MIFGAVLEMNFWVANLAVQYQNSVLKTPPPHKKVDIVCSKYNVLPAVGLGGVDLRVDWRSIPRVREGVKKRRFFLGLCPKHRTPPTHRTRLGLPKVKIKSQVYFDF